MGIPSKRGGRWLVIPVVAAMLASACSSQQGQPGGQTTSSGPAASAALPDGGAIRIRVNNSNLSDLNPRETAGGGGSMIATFARDRLIYRDSDGSYKPWVAKSWTTASNSITFTIKDGVKCHDGTPMGVKQIADSLRFLLDPSAAFVLRQRYLGTGPWTVTEDEKAKTIMVEFGSQGYGDNAVHAFSQSFFPIICPAGLKDPTSFVKGRLIHGTGPYVIKPEDIREGEGATARINPDWTWGPTEIDNKRRDRPQAIEFQVIANDTTASNLLVTSGIDAAGVAGADVLRLREEKSLKEWSGSQPGLWQLQFNHRADRPTADRVVRRAISMVVDQKAYVQAAWNGFGRTSPGLVLEDYECSFDPTKEFAEWRERGVDKAKAILAAAGYKPGAGGKVVKPDGQPFQLVFLGVSGSNHGNGEDYILSQLTAVGFDVKLNKVELGTWLRDLNASNFDVSVTHTNPENLLIVPSTIFGNFAPRGSNYSQIDVPEISKAVPAAIAGVGADRCKLWQDVQRLYLKDFHTFPLGTPTTFAFSRDFTWRPNFGGPGSLGAGVDPTTVVRMPK